MNEPALSTKHWVVVQRGDTLSKIAEIFLGDALLWPRIAYLNGFRNPNLIHPGQRVALPPTVNVGQSLLLPPLGAKKRGLCRVGLHSMECLVETDMHAHGASEVYYCRDCEHIIRRSYAER